MVCKHCEGLPKNSRGMLASGSYITHFSASGSDALVLFAFIAFFLVAVGTVIEKKKKSSSFVLVSVIPQNVGFLD